ncbi:MAG: hypothetical protein Q8N15_07680, partial [Bacillota bacterium]|nr:hypothetical protein [Bacillota bacterium]
WINLERRNAYRAINADPQFVLSEKVKLGVMPEYDVLKDLKTSEIAGEGILTISRLGLTYEGTKGGKPCFLHLSTDQLPTWGMCTDVSFFTTYIDGLYYEFYPNRESTGKWLHITEELHRINGGKWKNFPDADTYR